MGKNQLPEFAWRFERLSPWGGATGDAWNNALAGSTLTEEERLAREAIQNSDDAHDDDLIASAVRIRISRRTIQGKSLQALVKALDLDDGFKSRLSSLGLPAGSSFAEIISGERNQLEVTVVEDYNRPWRLFVIEKFSTIAKLPVPLCRQLIRSQKYLRDNQAQKD